MGKVNLKGLSALVREVRLITGMSQEELARAAGVSQGSISRLESRGGDRSPFLTVIAVLRVLDERLASMGAAEHPTSAGRLLQEAAVVMEAVIGLDPEKVAPVADDVRALLDAYRELSPGVQLAVRQLAETLAEEDA